MTEPRSGSNRVEVIVSGTTYDACLDPGCSEFHRENPDIPEPEFKRVGRGWRAHYGQLDTEKIDKLLYHLELHVDNFLGPDVDEFTRRQGRAIRKDYDRITAMIKTNKGN
ncbi:hypothetical protein [Nocardia ninae]|uniref:Uncharacterized protein n=1 Tax=Nocardia ninae NBRC 108245 TaxID=1210091 RepID=A0A511MMX3_9NOCA|nr:hypothetical protein [Nocardia ninae]GEM41953.1 hypothetical protein NN4_64720 [Nocardia ninae NBRC 108245]